EILWMVIESRDRRKNHHSHSRELQHVLEMYLAERGFSNHQHELASFLENHVSRAVDQIVAQAMCDGSESPQAAGRYDHPEGHERATRNSSALIGDWITLGSERLDFFD